MNKPQFFLSIHIRFNLVNLGFFCVGRSASAHTNKWGASGEIQPWAGGQLDRQALYPRNGAPLWLSRSGLIL